MAKPIFSLVRVCPQPVRQSIFDFARCTSIAGALCATSPVFAGSSDAELSNDSGDDPTHPLGRIELLDRFTETPGPGVAEGTTRRVDTNIPFARLWVKLRKARNEHTGGGQDREEREAAALEDVRGATEPLPI
jgi:hypothetical protein